MLPIVPRDFVRVVCFVAVIALTTGCGVVSTIHDSKYESKSDDGVAYFLPTNHVRVVFTNKTIPSEIKAATEALDLAKKKADAANKVLEDAVKARDKADPNKPDDIAKLDAAIEAARKALAAANTTRDEAEKALNAANTRNKKGQILVEGLPLVPDTSRLYIANLQHSIFSHDAMTLSTSPNGLLTQVKYRGEDQSGQVVQNIVETAIESAKLYLRLHGVPIPAPEPDEVAIAATPCTPPVSEDEYYWEFTIDPSDADAVSLVNRRLVRTPLPFLFSIRAPHAVDFVPPEVGRAERGFYYRRSIPYTVEVLEDAAKKEELCATLKALADTSDASENAAVRDFLESQAGRIPTSQSQQVLMAAGGPIAWFGIDARPFVTTELTATLKDGQLLEVVETRPSEAVGLTRIPLEAVTTVGNAVGEIVNSIIPLKIDLTNDRTALVEAQTKLLNAQMENAELRKKLLEPPDTNSETPP